MPVAKGYKQSPEHIANRCPPRFKIEEVTEKVCRKCGETKRPEEFRTRKIKLSGNRGFNVLLRSYCKPCESRMHGMYCEKTPHLRAKRKQWNKEIQLRRKYGISVEQYELMVRRQNSVCAICSNPCNRYGRLCVDHDHATGKIRGLLCNNCNRALGLIHDSLEIAERFVEYLTLAHIGHNPATIRVIEEAKRKRAS